MFFKKKTVSWLTPDGTFPSIYKDMAEQKHLLIAGTTGAGKSVVVNGIIYSLLYHSPLYAQFIFIDPKRVELVQYKHIPHCVYYASEPESMVQAMQEGMRITEDRYKAMAKEGSRKWAGSQLYIIIDELADLMTTCRKQVQPIIQRLCQIGRAAGVHVIACTQCPISKVLPTEIKVNFDSRLALRTQNKQDSRNIIDVPGCELLPEYGYGYYRKSTGTTLYKLPYVQDSKLNRLIAHWESRKCRK